MNTLGEHLARAEQHLQVAAERVTAEQRVDAAQEAALVSQCQQTATVVRELLTTIWGPGADTLLPIVGAEPRADRDTLVEMVSALDQRTGLPAGPDIATRSHPEARQVAAAGQEIRHADDILRAHVRPDRTARTPEAARLADDGARWTLTGRIADVTAALAAAGNGLAARQDTTQGLAYQECAARLLWAAREAQTAPHQGDDRVLAIHEVGHRPLDHSPLSDAAGLLERFCQRIWVRVGAGDLDGVSVRAAATTGILVTGHLEVVARAAEHRAPELWTGALGEIRAHELRRVTAEALTARQAWQQLQQEMRPLQPVGSPDVELTGQATQLRGALEAVTRRDDQWRPIEDLVRSRRDVEDLMHGTAQIAPDAEALASLLDRGLATARSADLCIRADQIPDRRAYIEERVRRAWVPAPPALLVSVRAAARSAEAATRTMAVSAAETRLSLAHQSSGQRLIAPTAAAAAPRQTEPADPVRRHAARRL